MAELAELFESRFEISDGDDGVSLVCTECSAEFQIPSAIEMVGRSEMDHADEIVGLIRQILEHLDQCQPTDE
jgi:hypothetical protein